MKKPNKGSNSPNQGKTQQNKSSNLKGKLQQHKQANSQGFRPTKNSPKVQAPSPTKPSKAPLEITGLYKMGKNGIGYVSVLDDENYYIVPSTNTGGALSGDKVKATTVKQGRDMVTTVTEIIDRKWKGFSGKLRPALSSFTLSAEQLENTVVAIPKDQSMNAKSGDYVFVEVVEWGDPLIGKVTEIFPNADSNDTHMKVIGLSKGFSLQFPTAVKDEAEGIAKRGITEEDLVGRKDMRGTTTFTIDPETAKDFDDALSVKDLGDGTFEIGIHIADVSHYVTEGSALDHEAQKRATSVYLVDRTIPMLPEELSNDLCSLNPRTDRLAFSVIVVLKPDGEVVSEWMGKTVIYSDHRFSYKEAHDILIAKAGPYEQELSILLSISQKLFKKRLSEGSLLIETEEVEFKLDDKGAPIAIVPKEHLITHNLIEEFMLLANRRTAEFMSNNAKAPFFIYRIHDIPNPEKTLELHRYLSLMGYDVPLLNESIPTYTLNKIIAEASEEMKPTLSLMIAKSMQKAIYSTQNRGHYGLGIEFYSHFTSPIRRYPDIMSHRLINKILTGVEINPNELARYKEDAEHSSIREKEAQDAEYASIKLKQAEYMAKHINEVFTGTITGATRFGLFIRESETHVEGLARLKEQTFDTLSYNDDTGLVTGKKLKKPLRIGDTVEFRITNSDPKKLQIDYRIQKILSQLG